MKIIPLKDQSTEWHEWRKAGIGSSDIAAIVGKNPYKTAMQVYEEKKGISNNVQYLNPAMKRGNQYEDTARRMFNQYKGYSFEPACIEHEEYDFFHASLDCYNKEHHEMCEIKIPTETNFEKYEEGEIPEYYRLQVQWQMLVGNFDEANFFVYNPDRNLSFVMKIDKDEELQAYLKEQALFFWKNLQNDTPPPLQKSDYIVINDPELSNLEMRYIDICNSIKALEKEKNALKNQVLDFGDGGNFKTDRLTVFMVPKTTLDKEKMIKDGIDISLYQKTTSFYYNIRINKGA